MTRIGNKGVKLDVWDIVAINSAIELPDYYVPWLNKQEHAHNAPHILPEGHCSAFIATGSYTKGGKIVMTSRAAADVVDNVIKLSSATPILSAAVAEGKLKIIGGIYRLSDGKVELID